MRDRLVTAALALAAAASAGCAQSAVVQSDLPIRRVVVYRNGVAYFERGGHVEADQVTFKMKQAEVGDFLATLAVMEKGGSSVRAAAFPLEAPHDDEDDEDPKPDAPKRRKKKDHHDDLRAVVLTLDGRAHDLDIGYVAAAPVWRPSYRLVVLPGGRSELQAWGIVENLSGEDWRNVRLALVAGAPLAFDSRLGTPVIPDRPVVTDEGEVIAAMPKSQTSVEQLEEERAPEPPPPAAEVPAPPPPPPAPGGGPRGSAAPAPVMVTTPMAPPKSARRAEAPLAQPARKPMPPSGPRDLRSLAAIAVQGGTTKYEIPNLVTVPDESATMVMLVAQNVVGESIFLFAPDSGVPDSSAHPFHVARFQNGTSGVLERGPIAVFEQGAFVGEGLLDPLPAGATATVPFATERAIGVDASKETDVQGARVAHIEGGVLTIERDAVIKTTYTVENGLADPAKVIVRHGRYGGSRLYQPPSGTEDNTGTGQALVPVVVGAHAKAKLVVDERSAEKEPTDWFGNMADAAIKAYLADKRSTGAGADALRSLWPLRDAIVAKIDARSKVQVELSQLASEAQEKRADLRAIEKNKTAEGLRRSLTTRLAAIAARQDVLTAQNITMSQDLAEMQVRWREGLRALPVVKGYPAD